MVTLLPGCTQTVLVDTDGTRSWAAVGSLTVTCQVCVSRICCVGSARTSSVWSCTLHSSVCVPSATVVESSR
jgi:hypothetical protein